MLEFPLPSRGQRDIPGVCMSASDDALLLLRDHARALAAVGRRSGADFRQVASLASNRDWRLYSAFSSHNGLKPSLVLELAPLLAPRLEILHDRLRSRLRRIRIETPLSRVQELDPACLRRIARRSGRTLIEKAGPKQLLPAVRRQPSFDTMENRVLLEAASRLRLLSGQELRGLSHEERGGPGQSLLRLQRASTALCDHPDLGGLGRPRPGERPSNALRGDPHYRAAWRAMRLLRAEEERFATEWRRLEGVWAELLTLAFWDAFARLGAEPIPTWVRVLDDAKSGLRLEVGEARRWRLGGGLFEVRTQANGVQLVRNGVGCFYPCELGVQSGRLSGWAGRPTRELAAELVASSLGEVHGRAPIVGRCDPRFAGISALDRTLVVATETATRTSCSVVGAVMGPEDETLPVVGRQASWLPDCVGPVDLHSTHTEALGHLVREHAAPVTALVVPEQLAEPELRRLRSTAGHCWTIWSSVAAVLAAAARHPERFPLRETPRRVAVVIETDAVRDVAILEETVDPDSVEERLWIRSLPLRHQLRGRAWNLPDETLGPWLRGGWGADEHCLAEGRLEAVSVPARPESGAAWKEALSESSCEPPHFVVLVGIKDNPWPELPSVVLAPEALAQGALVFLQRQAARLPTWKDRVPALDLEVRQGGLRKLISVLPPNLLVAPGEPIERISELGFGLPAGEPEVAFPMLVEKAQPFRVLVSGPPLPLGRSHRVRIRVSYRYGREGLTGTLVPQSGPLRRLPFTVRSAAGSGRREVGPPDLSVQPAWTEFDLGTLASIRVEEWVKEQLRALNGKQKKLAQKQPRFDKELRTLLKPLELGGTGEPDPVVRGELQRLAGELDWLLGIGVERGKKGRPRTRRSPFALGVSGVRGVALARARLGVADSGRFVHALAGGELPLNDQLRAECLSRSGLTEVGIGWEELLRLGRMVSPGPWGRAVARALRARPALAGTLSPEAAVALLEELVVGIERLRSDDGPGLYGLSSAIPPLCLARAAGGLPLESVEAYALRLDKARGRFSQAALEHGGVLGAHKGDESLAVAIGFLRGHYHAIPEID